MELQRITQVSLRFLEPLSFRLGLNGRLMDCHGDRTVFILGPTTSRCYGITVVIYCGLLVSSQMNEDKWDSYGQLGISSDMKHSWDIYRGD